jgi:hypothetical protein
MRPILSALSFIAAALLPAAALAQNTWLGPANVLGQWSTAGLWSFGVVPDGTTDILIPRGGVSGDTSFVNRHALNISSEGDLLIEAPTTVGNSGPSAFINVNFGGLSNFGVLINQLATINNKGILANSGVLENRVGGAIVNERRLENRAGGFLFINAGSTLVSQETLAIISNAAGATISNFGTVTHTAFKGGFFNAGVLSNFGILTADNLTNQGTATNTQVLSTTGFTNNTGTLKNLAGSWEATGGLSNSGSVTNAFGALLTTFRDLDNTGVVTNQGVVVYRGRIRNKAGGTFTNAVGATLDNHFVGTLRNEAGATFLNLGTITHGEHHSGFSNAGVFKNAGTLALSDVALFNSGPFTNSGAITMVLGSVQNTGTLINTGVLDQPAASFSSFINDGVVTNTGTMNLVNFVNNSNFFTNGTGGTLQLNQFTSQFGTTDATNAGHLQNRVGATLTNNTDLINTSVIDNTGRLINSTGATIRNDLFLHNFGRGAVINDGEIINPGLIITFERATFENRGVLQGGGTMIVGDRSVFTNRSTGGVALTGITVRGTLQNDGVVIVPSNGFLFVQDGGTLAGTGLIFGNVESAGTTSPGNSVGQATILGDYMQDATGRLLMELGGDAPGEYDSLTVTADLILDGTLDIDLVGGFTPSFGDSFALLTGFDSRAGEFRFAALPSLSPGLFWGLTYDDPGRQILLSVTGTIAALPPPPPTEVPGTSTLWMLMAAALVIGARRTRLRVAVRARIGEYWPWRTGS